MLLEEWFCGVRLGFFSSSSNQVSVFALAGFCLSLSLSLFLRCFWSWFFYDIIHSRSLLISAFLLPFIFSAPPFYYVDSFFCAVRQDEAPGSRYNTVGEDLAANPASSTESIADDATWLIWRFPLVFLKYCTVLFFINICRSGKSFVSYLFRGIPDMKKGEIKTSRFSSAL